MKIRIGRMCTFTLLSLLSLFGFAAQAGAQDELQAPSASPQLQWEAGKTHEAKIADPASGYGYSVLYTFCSSNCNDGAVPEFGSLIMDSTGNLYGTAAYGAHTPMLSITVARCSSSTKRLTRLCSTASALAIRILSA